MKNKQQNNNQSTKTQTNIRVVYQQVILCSNDVDLPCQYYYLYILLFIYTIIYIYYYLYILLFIYTIIYIYYYLYILLFIYTIIYYICFQLWTLFLLLNFSFFILLFFIAPVHGNWGTWQPVEWYSAPCSEGYRTRQRYCNNPSPAHGGRNCPGSSTSSRDCNECENGNGGCEHRCINTIGSYSCWCYPGFKRRAGDWKRCDGEYANLNYMTETLYKVSYILSQLRLVILWVRKKNMASGGWRHKVDVRDMTYHIYELHNGSLTDERSSGSLYPNAWWAVNIPGGGGGAAPLYKLYRYVPPQRVWFFSRFGLKTGIDFDH